VRGPYTVLCGKAENSPIAGTEYLTVMEVHYENISIEPFYEPPGTEASAKVTHARYPARVNLTSILATLRNSDETARASAGQ
jgi:hypothetical protein